MGKFIFNLSLKYFCNPFIKLDYQNELFFSCKNFLKEMEGIGNVRMKQTKYRKKKNKTNMNKNEIYIYDVKPKTLKFWSLSPSLSPAYARRNFDGWNAREFVEAKQEIWCTLSPVSIDDFFFFEEKINLNEVGDFQKRKKEGYNINNKIFWSWCNIFSIITKSNSPYWPTIIFFKKMINFKYESKRRKERKKENLLQFSKSF